MTLKRRGRISPAVTVAMSLLCLFGQLLAVVHEATERHVRCAEHGELSHLASGGMAAERARPGRSLDSSFDDRSSFDTQSSVVASDHDHCAFLTCAKRGPTQPILLVSAAPEPAPRPAPGPAPVLEPQTERILLSAPKIAPPSC